MREHVRPELSERRGITAIKRVHPDLQAAGAGHVVRYRTLELIQNKLSSPVTIHPHGIFYTQEMDGAYKGQLA